MKLIFILTFGVCLTASATGYSQKINLSERNASLKSVFREIEKQTDYNFLYRDEWIKGAKKVSVKTNNATLEEVLRLCLADQPLTYSIIGNTIVIKQKDAEPETTFVHQLPDVLIDVSGTVTDENGKPLIRASVRVKGTTNGTATDKDGHFTLKGVGEKAVLVISFVGYESEEVAVSGIQNITVKLKQSENINETIVVGYGTKQKAYNTDAVSSIKSEDIEKMFTANLSQVFAGRLPGVLARTSVGSPGDESATLLIRTTDRSQDPLLVVDGVPSTLSLDVLDPSEVESISILKDNSATAVYGARAANGVIVVTTKRGKIGKPQFTLTSNMTWSSPTKMVKNLDAYHFALAYNEYNENSGLGNTYSPEILDTIKNQLSPYRYANTDWIKLLTGEPGFVQSHALNITGGSEAIKYFISGTFTNDGGMFPGNYYKRYTIQNNLDIKLSNQFKAQVNVGYRNGYQHVPGSALPSNAMSVGISISPLIAAYMPDGSWGGTASGVNPLATLSEEAGFSYNSKNYLTGNGRLTWESPFAKGLSAYVNFNVQKYNSRSKNYDVPVPMYNLDPNSSTGYKQVGGKGKPSVSDNVSDALYSTIDAALTYKKQLGKHGIDALALFTVSKYSSNSNYARRINLVAPGLDVIDLGPSENESISGSRSQSGRAGYVGRLGYNFDRRLFAELSFRFDGSSKFAPGHRWGFFPGVSAGWTISKEKFFAPLTDVVSQLKFRASIGLAGDDNIGSNTYYYLYRVANTGQFQGGAYVFGNNFQPAFVLNNKTLPNEDITWAKNLQTNFGLDASLWRGRLGITFDVFQKDRYDILRSKSYNLPGTFGIDGPIQNYAKMQDRGFELALTSENKLSRDLKLLINASITSVKTEYVEWGTKDLPGYQRYEGHTTNTLIGYKALGLFQSTEEIEKYQVDQDGLGNKTIKPGDIKYEDRDGDNRITVADQIWIDNYGFPPINYGFGFDLSYKNLTLSTFFNGAKGGYLIYAKNYEWDYIYRNSWRPGNENAEYPRIGKSKNNEKASDATLTKSDFLRLRNIRLSYSLPDSWMHSVKLKGVDVYVQATNLFTLTSVLGGIDPEAPAPAVASGTGGGFYPNQKNIGLGINIQF